MKKDNLLNKLVEKYPTYIEALNIIDDLKRQLEEKEKERHEEWKTGKEWKWEWQKVNQELEKAEQEKISFAVEQLEKVKELLLEKCGETYSKTYCGIDEDIEEIIGNQINELKEGK